MGTAAILVAGLLPLVLGVVGIWMFVQRGYVTSRAGERMDDVWVWWYGLLIVAAATGIGYGIAFYRRHKNEAGG